MSASFEASPNSVSVHSSVTTHFPVEQPDEFGTVYGDLQKMFDLLKGSLEQSTGNNQELLRDLKHKIADMYEILRDNFTPESYEANLLRKIHMDLFFLFIDSRYYKIDKEFIFTFGIFKTHEQICEEIEQFVKQTETEIDNPPLSYSAIKMTAGCSISMFRDLMDSFDGLPNEQQTIAIESALRYADHFRKSFILLMITDPVKYSQNSKEYGILVDYQKRFFSIFIEKGLYKMNDEWRVFVFEFAMYM